MNLIQCQRTVEKQLIKRAIIRRKNGKIKGKKHKQTKEKEIPKKVKEAVWKRDKHKCIFCGKQVDIFFANAHFIPRSAGRFRNRRKYIYCL